MICRRQSATFAGPRPPSRAACLDASQLSRCWGRKTFGYTSRNNAPLRAALENGADPDYPEDAQQSRLSFTYMNADAVAAMEQRWAQDREQSLEEYEDLKQLLLKRTWRFGTLFAAYLLFTVSTEAAFAELVGAAASYGYFLWLIRDAESLGPDSAVPLKAAEAMQPGSARNLAKIGAAYKQALTPRLLVPVGLIAAAAAWNQLLPDYTLSLVDQGCMLGGFLSYKIALILKIYDDLKPRALTEEEMLRASRPQLVEVEDVPLALKRPSESNTTVDTEDSSN
jgi:hypothetical protein